MNSDMSRELMSRLVLAVEETEAAEQVREAFNNPRPSTASRRVVIYIRAKDDHMVEYQRQRLISYAALKGWDVVSIHVAERDDPSTAKLSRRTELRKFKEAVDANVDIDGILITNYGALASNADLYFEVKRHFDRDIIPMVGDAVYEVL